MLPTPVADVVLPSVPVLDTTMAYRASGRESAPSVLFLHGNPTSSYIWRHVLPHVAAVGRCVAPDLVGFGQSGKPDIGYRFADHAGYLDAFLEAMAIESAYVVAQDWGTALAFDLAARRPSFVRGLAFMEFIRPMPTWADFHQSDAARTLFRQFRTPGVGETLIEDQNVFVERVLPGSVRRPLSEDERNAYVAPFPTPRSRRPIWRFANDLPIEGQPADVVARLTDAYQALRRSTYPKLLFVGDPGALVSPAAARQLCDELTDCTLIELGSGLHYLQEDHAETIGQAVAAWVATRHTR
jgi:haloalkane dehalogenase